MKRLLALILIAILLASAAAAEKTTFTHSMFRSVFEEGKSPLYSTDFDLSDLTFEDLSALSTLCQAEMMTRDEWQEVTVPQGDYQVGVDIPAGKWVIRCADIGRSSYLLQETYITWGSEKPVGGFVPYSGKKGDVQIYNPNSSYYGGEVTQYVIELAKGDWIAIHPQYNAAVFTPYTGTGLGFK